MKAVYPERFDKLDTSEGAKVGQSTNGRYWITSIAEYVFVYDKVGFGSEGYRFIFHMPEKEIKYINVNNNGIAIIQVEDRFLFWDFNAEDWIDNNFFGNQLYGFSENYLLQDQSEGWKKLEILTLKGDVVGFLDVDESYLISFFEMRDHLLVVTDEYESKITIYRIDKKTYSIEQITLPWEDERMDRLSYYFVNKQANPTLVKVVEDKFFISSPNQGVSGNCTQSEFSARFEFFPLNIHVSDGYTRDELAESFTELQESRVFEKLLLDYQPIKEQCVLAYWQHEGKRFVLTTYCLILLDETSDCETNENNGSAIFLSQDFKHVEEPSLPPLMDMSDSKRDELYHWYLAPDLKRKDFRQIIHIAKTAIECSDIEKAFYPYLNGYSSNADCDELFQLMLNVASSKQIVMIASKEGGYKDVLIEMTLRFLVLVRLSAINDYYVDPTVKLLSEMMSREWWKDESIIENLVVSLVLVITDWMREDSDNREHYRKLSDELKLVLPVVEPDTFLLSETSQNSIQSMFELIKRSPDDLAKTLFLKLNATYACSIAKISNYATEFINWYELSCEDLLPSDYTGRMNYIVGQVKKAQLTEFIERQAAELKACQTAQEVLDIVERENGYIELQDLEDKIPLLDEVMISTLRLLAMGYLAHRITKYGESYSSEISWDGMLTGVVINDVNDFESETIARKSNFYQSLAMSVWDNVLDSDAKQLLTLFPDIAAYFTGKPKTLFDATSNLIRHNYMSASLE